MGNMWKYEWNMGELCVKYVGTMCEMNNKYGFITRGMWSTDGFSLFSQVLRLAVLQLPTQIIELFDQVSSYQRLDIEN